MFPKEILNCDNLQQNVGNRGGDSDGGGCDGHRVGGGGDAGGDSSGDGGVDGGVVGIVTMVLMLPVVIMRVDYGGSCEGGGGDGCMVGYSSFGHFLVIYTFCWLTFSFLLQIFQN